MHAMSLSVPQAHSGAAPGRCLTGSCRVLGFFLLLEGCCFFFFFWRWPVPVFVFHLKVSDKNKRRQVAYLVCLCNPAPPSHVLVFLRFLVVFFPFLLVFIRPCLQHTGWLGLCSHPALGGSAVASCCVEGAARRRSTVHSVTNLVLYCTYR